MNLRKLSSVLEAMDAPTFDRLKEYMYSPFFRVQPKVLEMFNYLATEYPNISDEHINSKAIAKGIPSLTTKQRQKVVGTRVLEEVYNFIALTQWQKKEQNAYLPLIHGLRELNLYELGYAELKHAISLIDKDTDQEVETFYLRHILTENSFTGFDSITQRNADNDVSAAAETLEQFYALKILRAMCESLNRRNLVGTRFYTDSMTKVLETLAPLTTPKYPYVWIYVNVYKLLTAETFEEGRKAYFRIEYMVKRNEKQPFPPYLLDGIKYSINWSLQWISRGLPEAIQYYLWWIDYRINHNLLLTHKQIQPITFRNTIMLAIEGMRSQEWVEQFIKKYASHLPTESREINETFAKALLRYYRKEHASAARLFQQISAKGEPVFNVIIRRWQYMNLFEANPQSNRVLKETLSSFERFLQRNKERLPMRTIFSKFVSYGNYILSSQNETEVESYKNKLMSEPFFPGKNWLVNQFEKKILSSPKYA